MKQIFIEDDMFEECCPYCNCGDGWLSKHDADFKSKKGKLFCLECWKFVKPILRKRGQ